MRNVPHCFGCKHKENYYRYKTATRGRPRLVSSYCGHPKIKEEDGGFKRFIENNRYGLIIVESPLWCPLRRKDGTSI